MVAVRFRDDRENVVHPPSIAADSPAKRFNVRSASIRRSRRQAQRRRVNPSAADVGRTQGPDDFAEQLAVGPEPAAPRSAFQIATLAEIEFTQPKTTLLRTNP